MPKIVFFVTIAIFAVAARLLPHPANFAPIGAISLMAGTHLSKKYALLLPILVMFISDYWIGVYDIKLMASVYGSFLLIVFVGFWLKRNKKPSTVIISSLAGSFLFFLITNAAVWAFSPWYSKDIVGLLTSYTLAIPFFKNTLFGDLFYAGVFFGAYEVLYRKEILYNLMKQKIVLLPGFNVITIKKH